MKLHKSESEEVSFPSHSEGIVMSPLFSRRDWINNANAFGERRCNRNKRGNVLTELITGVNQIGPHTNALVVVVSEARRAFVFGSLAVPAGVKDTAVRGVSKDAVQSGTVGCADRRFCLREQTKGKTGCQAHDLIHRGESVWNVCSYHFHSAFPYWES